MCSPAESGVGTIDYARVEFPKLEGSVVMPCRQETRSYELSIAQRVGGAFLRWNGAAQSCGKPFELTTLAPGSYRLQAQVVDSTAAAVLYAMADVDLAEGTEKNIEMKPLSTVVSGRVVCDCEKPSEVALEGIVPEGIKVSIFSFGETGGWGSSADVGRDGTIPAMPCPIAGSAMVEVRGLPPGLAVKRMVFNGGESGLTLSPGSAARVEITLADRVASVSGKAPGARVAIAAWPFVYPNFRSVETGKDGKFAFADLAPGDYRVVSVTPEQWERKEMPGAVADWLAGADTITLGARELRTVDLGRE
jgi:hypothetical protein